MNTEEKYKYITSIDMFLYILFGPSSEFREDMLKKDFYSFFYSSESIVDDLLLIEFVAETKHPDELKEEIIKYFKTKKITKDDVERVKKIKLAIDVMGSDNPERMMSTIIDHYIDFGEIIYNKIDIIKSITYDDIVKNSKDILIDNYSFVTGYKK
jgi:predicted Zn-dependent peptidase